MVVQIEHLMQLFNRNWRVGVHFPVPGLTCLFTSLNQVLSRFELRHDTVNRRAVFDGHFTGSFTRVLTLGSSMRSSKMEIIGSTRIKRKISVKKKPMVPK